MKNVDVFDNNFNELTSIEILHISGGGVTPSSEVGYDVGYAIGKTAYYIEYNFWPSVKSGFNDVLALF